MDEEGIVNDFTLDEAKALLEVLCTDARVDAATNESPDLLDDAKLLLKFSILFELANGHPDGPKAGLTEMGGIPEDVGALLSAAQKRFELASEEEQAKAMEQADRKAAEEANDDSIHSAREGLENLKGLYNYGKSMGKITQDLDLDTEEGVLGMIMHLYPRLIACSDPFDPVGYYFQAIYICDAVEVLIKIHGYEMDTLAETLGITEDRLDGIVKYALETDPAYIKEIEENRKSIKTKRAFADFAKKMNENDIATFIKEYNRAKREGVFEEHEKCDLNTMDGVLKCLSVNIYPKISDFGNADFDMVGSYPAAEIMTYGINLLEMVYDQSIEGIGKQIGASAEQLNNIREFFWEPEKFGVTQAQISGTQHGTEPGSSGPSGSD